MITEAGLTEPQISVKKYNLDILDNCNDSLYQTLRRHLPEGTKLSDYVVSADITVYRKT